MATVQTLFYLDNHVSQEIKCLICLEAVTASAIQISCHEHVSCFDCVSYWFGSQLDRRLPTTCPYCRARVDTLHLEAAYNASQERYSAGQDCYVDSMPDFNFDDEDEDEDDKTLQDDVEDEGRIEPCNSDTSEGQDTVMDDLSPETLACNSSENEMPANMKDEFPFPQQPTSDASEPWNAFQGSSQDDLEENEALSMESSESSDSVPDEETFTEEIQIPNQDDGTPEGFMRNNRYHNIVARRPAVNERSLLLARQPDFENPYSFPYQPRPWNILYASNLVPSTSFTIVAEYGVDPQPIEYYYILVMKFTTVRELVWLWSLVNVGEVFQGTDAASSFKYKGREMGLDLTMEELGMDHGSTFTIPLAFGGVAME